MPRGLLLGVLLVLVAACSREQTPEPSYYPGANPQLLSEWGAIGISGDALVLGNGVTPYALNTPLFTDYAHKLRTIWSPNGPGAYEDDEVFDFPVGTVITKTFYYPRGEGGSVLKADDRDPVHHGAGLSLADHRLLETRLLVRRQDGWHPVSYIWNEEQTDARLKRTGAVIPMQLATDSGAQDFAYIVPNENQCAACHATNATTARIMPIGPKPGQLNRAYDYGGGAKNQLAHWVDAGLAREPGAPAPSQVSWLDEKASLDARARSYLDANCAHCHNPVGPADTSGLDLTLDADGPALGRCKLPIAAGSGTGGRRYGIDPGAPGQSILTYRLASKDPGAMMPELGRSLVHEEGLALIEAWIAEMEGGCA